MKKKICKYIKFLFCISIILLLIVPSYATAVSGDAFLTKEEFDKKLSDFSERIASFEAGINSKIDVQVSSYLDRNGIWSKRKQIDYKSTEKAMKELAGIFLNYYAVTLNNTNPAIGNPELVVWKEKLYKSTKYGLAVSTFCWNVDWLLGYYSNGENHKLTEGFPTDTSIIYNSNDEKKINTKIDVFETFEQGTKIFDFSSSIGGKKSKLKFIYFVDKDVEYYVKLAIRFTGRCYADGTFTAPTYGPSAAKSSSYNGEVYTGAGADNTSFCYNDNRPVFITAETDVY